MKFQNCILINFVSDGGTDKPKAICPFNFSKLGGIKNDFCVMQVKSIAECSNGSILQYFRPSLSYQLSLRPLFCLFLSGRLRQVCGLS